MLKKATLSLDKVSSKIKGAKVVMRVDWNVPYKDGKITDPTRVKETINTIDYIMQRSPASLVLLSHLGRPDGKVKPQFSFKPLVSSFQQITGKHIKFMGDCVSNDTIQEVSSSSNGQIFLCENVRFYLEEEGSVKDKKGNKTVADKDKVADFRKRLSQLGNFYVNDAFGAAHRAHSSIVGVNHAVRVAGLLMKKQLQYFGQIIQNPTKPITVILGGAKINDKIKLIDRMMEIASQIIIGGGMSYTFQKKKGFKIGKSLFDQEGFNQIQNILKRAAAKNVKVHIPVDVRVAESPSSDKIVECQFQADKGIPDNMEGFDIGPATVQMFKGLLQDSKTIIWNGPLGFFEQESFRKGSASIVEEVCRLTRQKKVLSVIGGGDTASLVKSVGAESKISHVSTGGGATLQLLQGNPMPGVDSLSNIQDIK